MTKAFLKTGLFLVLVIAFALALGAQATAAEFFVAPVKTEDADPNLAKSLKSIVESSVVSAGGQVATDEGKADFTLQTDLVRLGGAYILTVTKKKRGAAIYSSKQKAASVEELDEASDRAVRAAIIDTPAKHDTRVGEVKPRDENVLRTRVHSRDTSYFGFGAASLQNMDNTNLAYDFAMGHNWEVSPKAQIRTVLDLAAANDWKAYYASLQLGLNIFLADTDSSPYIGAGLGFGASGSSGTSATTLGGFAGSAGVGWQFFRTTSTQFDVFCGYDMMFANNNIGNPGAAFARIGVLY